MPNMKRMSEEFKRLITDEYLLKNTNGVKGFWEVRGTEVKISDHEYKDIPISGYLDENAREHPNTVVIPNGNGSQIYLPVEWVTIVSMRKNTRVIPDKKKLIQEAREKHDRKAKRKI